MATLSTDQVAALVRKHFGDLSAADQAVMVAVVFAESGGKTDAVNRGNSNGSADFGLFQVNSVHWGNVAEAKRLDPETNAAMARKVYNSQGIRAWSAFKNESYAKFLPQAKVSVAKVGGGLKGPIDVGGSSATPTVPPLKAPDVDLGAIGGAFTGAGGTLASKLDVGSAISEGINSLGRTLARFANSYALWLAVIVCLILGVVILLRKPIANVVPLGKAGKVLNVAKAVTAK